MLLDMSDEFISKSILSRVVIIKNDISECEGYRIDLSKNHNKNDIYHTIESADINKSGILSDCIYIDINKSRQNLYLRFISVLYNLSNNSALGNNGIKDHNVDLPPVITYNF